MKHCHFITKPWLLSSPTLLVLITTTLMMKEVNGSSEFNHSLLLKEIRKITSEFAAALADDPKVTCDHLITDILDKSENNFELCNTLYPQAPVRYYSGPNIEAKERCTCLASLLNLITPVKNEFLNTFCESSMQSDFVCDRYCDKLLVNDTAMILAFEDEPYCIVRAKSELSAPTAFKTAGNMTVVGVITGLSCNNIRNYGFEVCKDILYPPSDNSKNTAGLVPGIVILILILVIVCIISISCYLHSKSKRKMKHLRKVEAMYSATGPDHYVQRNLDNPLYTFAATSLPDTYSKSTLMTDFKNHFNLKLIPRSDFKIISELGQGAFGVVYKGVCSHLKEEGKGMEVAIKTLKDNSTMEETREFICEAAVMAEFQHPNVMSILGLCIDEDDDDDGTATTTIQPMILLPYMVNGDLKAFLVSSRIDNSVEKVPEHLSLNKLESMCLNIAEGMKYLAELKYVHRDLAARNCMIDEDLNVKVADFGFTRDIYGVEYYRLSRKTKLPVKWMAPESLLDNVYDEKTDVWAFGVTCWEVFGLGRAPYPGIDNSEIPDYIKRGNRLKKPFLCPSAMYLQIISNCWNGDPKMRLSFRELVQEIIGIITGSSSSDKPHENSEVVQNRHSYFVLDHDGDSDQNQHETDTTDCVNKPAQDQKHSD